MWSPPELPADRPKYLALADAIGAAIRTGQLQAGEQLPTHRDLAARLDVTTGTVTRAYAEAARRGLLEATVGRGSFVRGGAPQATDFAPVGLRESAPREIDFSLNCPAPTRLPQVLDAFRHLADPAVLPGLLRYTESAGRPRHREVVARWLTDQVMPTAAGQVVVTTGCQQALMLALSACCRPGSVLLTEQLTYMGAIASARLLGLRVETVALDDEGMVPAAFAAACEEHRPSAVYCTPTIQNPTGTVLPVARRRELAAIADRHGVRIVEDEVHGYLLPERLPPMVSFAETPGFYVSGVSKSVAGGLRIGFLRTEVADERLDVGMWGTTIMAPPPLVEVATRLIGNGALGEIEAERRRDARTRQLLAREVLGDWVAPGVDPHSQFVWLTVPAGSVDHTVASALAAGVRVSPSTQFAPDGRARDGVRVALVHEADEGRVREGLERLREVLDGLPRRHRVLGV